MPAPPQHCPAPRELDDLELLLSGALAPWTGFDEPGSPVRLTLPAELADAPEVELVDPEGLPLARAEREPSGAWRLSPLARPEYGPFRRLHLSPAEVREQYAGRTVVPVVEALTRAQLAELSARGPLVLLALCGAGTSSLTPVGLLRATLLAAEQLDAVVVAVPLATHGDPAADHDLGVQVVRTYAGDDPVLAPTTPAADGSVGDDLDARIAAVVEHDRPGPGEQGLVLFFTGLSGSGKSTLARALMDRVLETGARTVTSLDGDVVRRHLSAGLTFSRADRETNITRIGWVAAEIARHGGVAVCSPIAPFARTRRQVRAMVEDAGGHFFLVHVATPLAECERRDRKGLYAKARRGEIPDFTGISSPYEEPDDADVRVDTTGRSIPDALQDVLEALTATGHLHLSAGPPATEDRGRGVEVLFVCTANICRSAYMELLARRGARDADAALSFSSAGTHGFDARGIDPVIASELAARGIDPTTFQSRPVTAELLARADVVLTAETEHLTRLLAQHPGAASKTFTLGQFVEVAREVPAEVRGLDLIEQVAARRPTPDPGLDVLDPYGHGPEVATDAARHLDELVHTLVARLA